MFHLRLPKWIRIRLCNVYRPENCRKLDNRPLWDTIIVIQNEGFVPIILINLYTNTNQNLNYNFSIPIHWIYIFVSTHHISHSRFIYGDSFGLSACFFTLKSSLLTAQKVSVFRVILVRIFPHLNWIRRDISYLSVFIPNAGKNGPE